MAVRLGVHTILNALLDPVDEIGDARVNSRLLSQGAVFSPADHTDQLPSSAGPGTLQRTSRITDARVSAARGVSGTEHSRFVVRLSVPVGTTAVFRRDCTHYQLLQHRRCDKAYNSSTQQLCTSFRGVKRGQILEDKAEAEAEAKSSRPRPRPRPKT